MKTPLVGTPYVIHEQEGHNYNLDSILLASFIKEIPKHIHTIYDFGTGQGVLMFYLRQKTDAEIIGYDIQQSLVDLANETILSNDIKRVKAIHQDINDVSLHQTQMIVSNPPYFKVTKDIPLSDLKTRQIARHEIHLTLETLIKVTSKSLRTKGVFYMSYRPERLQELMYVSRLYQLNIKEIRYVHAYIESPANLMLVKMVKNAGEGVNILKPLIMYDSKHEMSVALKAIYKGE